MKILKYSMNILMCRIDGLLQRISIVAAYAASGALAWLAKLPAQNVGAEAARGWLIFATLPPWLLICLIAVRSGNRLGGVWNWLAWPPLAVPTLWFIANGLSEVDWSRLVGDLMQP